MQKRSKKRIISLFGGFIVVFLCFALLSTKAQGQEKVRLYLVSSQDTFNVGDTFTVDIKLDTGGETVIGVKADINFSNHLTVPSGQADVSDSDFGMVAINRVKDHKLEIEAVDVSGLKGNGLLIGRIQFKAQISGTASIQFDPSCQVNSAQNGADILEEKDNLSLTISTPRNASLTLNPLHGEYKKGETFNVQVLLDTGQIETEGVDIHYLQFDSEILEVEEILPGDLYSQTLTATFDNEQGLIDFSQRTQQGEVFKGSGVLLTIVFRAKQEGRSNLSFDFTEGSFSDSNVFKAGYQEDVLGNVDQATFLVSVPQQILRVKVVPEGIENLENLPVQVKIEFSRGGQNQVIHNRQGRLDARGYYSQEIDLSSYGAGEYKIKVKVPHYLGKIKTISLSQERGAEVEISLLAGNLQDSDNIINSLDWSVMVKNWLTDDPVADINKDGQVNSLDWYYLNKNWGKRGDW